MCLLLPHYRGQCSKNSKQPCCMRSQSHGRLWPLLKLKFGNCWLTSKCCGSSCKKINSSFQCQFQSFQFQFHFQFHQFQFQLRNWNWDWAEIPIPELNWLQPCHLPTQYTTDTITLQLWTNNKTNISYKQLLYIHISCKCDTNRAGHFTLDAHASRPVACHSCCRQAITAHSENYYCALCLNFVVSYCRWPEDYTLNPGSLHNTFGNHMNSSKPAKHSPNIWVNQPYEFTGNS